MLLVFGTMWAPPHPAHAKIDLAQKVDPIVEYLNKLISRSEGFWRLLILAMLRNAGLLIFKKTPSVPVKLSL